jgi:hypothetical protein
LVFTVHPLRLADLAAEDAEKDADHILCSFLCIQLVMELPG